MLRARNKTESQVTFLSWNIMDVTMATMKAAMIMQAIEMMATTFVNTGFFADNAERNKTDNTKPKRANGDEPEAAVSNLEII